MIIGETTVMTNNHMQMVPPTKNSSTKIINIHVQFKGVTLVCYFLLWFKQTAHNTEFGVKTGMHKNNASVNFTTMFERYIELLLKLSDIRNSTVDISN